MADATFNTVSGQTIKRELLICFMNTGTEIAPVWSAVGKRVTDSSANYDWSKETNADILGNVYSKLKKPQVEQSFDPYDLDGGDAAGTTIWNKGIKDQDYTALAGMDLLIVHLYAGTADTAMFAERYSACAVTPSSIGGEGGGTLAMPFDVTYGGTRTLGTAAINAGVVTFTPAA